MISLTTPRPEGSRCPELTRVDQGWSRCRRDLHDPAERHHVAGRSWSTAGNMPLLRFETCTEPGCCTWPEQITNYLGAQVARSGQTVPGPRGGRKRRNREAADVQP